MDENTNIDAAAAATSKTTTVTTTVEINPTTDTPSINNNDDDSGVAAAAAAAAPEEEEEEGDCDQPDDDTTTTTTTATGPRRQSSRTPFTTLSQEDADLALARTLQEQERAYLMLSMGGGGGGIGYGSWGTYYHDGEDDDFDDSHEHEYAEGDGEDADEDEDDDDSEDDDAEDYDDEDAFDVHAHSESEEDNDHGGVELDPAAFPDDESYARALQDAEEREMAARLLAMAGLNEREVIDVEDHGGHSQDAWEEVDPDELSYEELLALGEIVGTESRGLSADTIASLPSSNYKSKSAQESECDSCVICRLDYEDDETLTTLPCKHAYHSECINNWLKINKACPVCSAEVSTSGNC